MLQPKYAKQLDANIRELISNGGSSEDVDKMASDYTSLFSDEALKKKEASKRIVPTPKLDLETTTGSSVGNDARFGPELKTILPKVDSGESAKSVVDKKALAKSKRVKELEKSFYDSTKDDTDDSVAEQRLQDRKNNKGFWNTAEDLTKSAYNTVIDAMSSTTPILSGLQKAKISEDPLADEKKQALQEAKKNKITLSEIQKNARAEEIFKQKEKDNLFIDRANSFLDNLDVNDKDILQQDRLEKAVHLKLENQKKINVVSAMEIVGNEKIKEYQNVEKQLLSLNEKNQEFPKDLYDKYVGLSEEIKQIGGNIEKYSDQIQKNKSDLGTAEQEFDLFKRGYGDVDNFIGNAIATTGELANGIFGAVNYLASFSPDPIARLNSLRGQKVASKISGSLEEYRGALRKPVESVESAEGLVNYASDLVANQLPILAITSTGAGGLAVLGASTTGQTFTKINEEVLSGKANYSSLQMASIPLLQGGFEVISEIPTLSILKKGSRVISAAAKGEVDLIKKSGAEVFKGYSKDFGKEFGGEHITNLGQNFNAKYVQGKDEVGLLDNTGRVSKDTAFLTTLLQGSPHVFGAVAKVFQSNNDLGTLDENSRKIIEFSKQLNTEGLTDTEKTVIQKQIDKATSESSNIVANTIGKIGEMPNPVYDEILSLNSQAGKIKAEAKEIQDGKLPNKKELLVSLGQDYKELQIKRSGLVDGSITAFDLLSGKEQANRLTQASREIIKRDNPDGTKEKFEVKPEDAKKLANENYLKEIKEKENEQNSSTPTTETQPQAEVPQQAESEKVAEVSPEIADVEKRRQVEIKKYDERDARSLEAITPNNPNHPTFKVGMKRNAGDNVIVDKTNTDNWNGEGDGYTVITAVKSPAEFDSNGKMTKAAKVEEGIFNSKEEADAAIQATFEKVKNSAGKAQEKANAKYDAELEALKPKETPKPQEVSPVEDVVAKDEVDELIINARKGDKQSQATLNKNGLGWEEKPKYRIIGQQELDVLDKEGKVKSNRDSGHGKTDITDNPEYGKVGGGEGTYRVKFKNTNKFDSKMSDTKTREKNAKEGEFLLEGEYTNDDIEYVEKLVEDEKGNKTWIKLENEATPETNTPTDGNVQLGASNVGESGNAEPKTPAKESVSSSVDGGEVKGDVEVTIGKNNHKFYTGRKTKIEDFSKTKGEFIFFSKDKKVSEHYGGDNITEANVDTSGFLDLSTQEKKTAFVKENFTDEDIHKLYPDIKRNAFDRQTNIKGFEEIEKEIIQGYRTSLENNRFSGDGEVQNAILRKIKAKGHTGVVLEDSFFGKKDMSYVVFDKSVINSGKTTETPQPKSKGDASVVNYANNWVEKTNAELESKGYKGNIKLAPKTEYNGFKVGEIVENKHNDDISHIKGFVEEDGDIRAITTNDKYVHISNLKKADGVARLVFSKFAEIDGDTKKRNELLLNLSEKQKQEINDNYVTLINEGNIKETPKNSDVTNDYSEKPTETPRPKSKGDVEVGKIKPNIGDKVDFGEGEEVITGFAEIQGQTFIKSKPIEGNMVNRESLNPLSEYNDVLSKQEEYSKRAEENKKAQKEREIEAENKAKKQQEKQNEFEDIDGFANDKTAIQKGKILQHLNKQVYRGTIKSELRRIANLPHRFIERDGKKRVIYTEENGTEFLLSDVYTTKTGLEYLQYLVDKNAKTVETAQVENKQKSTTKERIAERIKLSDAKIDENSEIVKAKIKAFMDMFPSADINPDDYHTNGFSADAIIDMVAKAAKSLIEAGIRMDEAIKQAIEGYNTHFDDKIDPKVIEENIRKEATDNEKSNPKKEADNDFKREKGKSSVLKRIREGGNSSEINDIIDKIGLNYEGRKQEQVYADGVNFVKEVGIAEAYNAIKNGELKDSDTINVVYATILQEFPKMAENEISKVSDPQELSDLVKELDDFHEKIYTEFKTRTIDAGRGSAILNFIYNQDLKIRYSLSQQIENFKKVNNGVVPAETLSKMKELDKQYKEANKRIEELENLLKEAQEQQDFQSIIEEEKRVPKISKTKREKADKIIKALDDFEKSILKNSYSDATMITPILIQGIRATKLAINQGVNISEAIEKGIEGIKKELEKIGKSFDNEELFRNDLNKSLENSGVDLKQPKVTVDKNGKVRIPSEMIKDFASKGGTDLSEFAKQLQESIKDEFPDVSVRNIRESVANYGKKANKSRPQIVADIQKLKSEERLRLEYEDLQNRITKEKNEIRKRELSQTQKRLKEQIKQLQDNLGITEEERTNRSVNYTKKRIEQLREKIKNNDFAKKEIKPIVESPELKQAKIEKNRIQEEFDYLSYQQELENRTLRDKIKQFGSDMYDSQRVTLATGEMSFVGAQGGLYMVDSTFSRKTLKNLIENFKGTTIKDWKSNPIGTAFKVAKSAHSAESLIKMFNTMGTANNYVDFQRLLKEDANYDVYLKSGLRLLGEDVKSQVKDDNFIGNNILTLLKIPIHLTDRIEKKELLNFKLKLADEAKKRTTLQGYYEKLKTGKISDKNKKTATEIFSNTNPLATFERGNSVFMNMARVEMFNKYAAALYASGKNPIDHLDDFKKLASAVNTVTGSGNMNQTVTMALPILNKLMFSARYFAASWNLTPPMSLYYLYKLGNYDNSTLENPKTWKNIKATPAQKAFVKPMVKGFIAFYAASLFTMAMINAAIDDDDEMTEEEKAKKRAYIEYDPRSSDWMQVVSGNVRTDYFGPYRGNVVLMSKLLSGQTKTKSGEIIENGSKFGSRTDFQIATEYLAGKSNPFPGMFIRYSMGKKEEVTNEETGEKENRRMLYDDRVGIDYQIKHNTIPIFAKTVGDVFKEDPVLGAEFYTALALFGKQTNVYQKSKNSKKNSRGRSSRSGRRNR